MRARICTSETERLDAVTLISFITLLAQTLHVAMREISVVHCSGCERRVMREISVVHCSGCERRVMREISIV